MARLLLLIFGLSVAGYVLLDFSHEVLHGINTTLHNHQLAAHKNDHAHNHHHVEDHQTIFTTDSHQQYQQESSVQISYFLFYFQKPLEYILPQALNENFEEILFTELTNIFIPPPTPPPPSIYIV